MNVLVETRGTHEKLVSTVFSLLLLVLVTYSTSFLDKGSAASDTHIVAAGDWHCTEEAVTTVNVAESLKPQIILGLGDYSNTKNESCWVNLSKQVDSFTKIAFGNHDNEYNGLAKSYLDHYGLSKQFYSFDFKNVHVLTMATDVEFDAGSEQYKFVVSDLTNSANNPDIKWIIVTMHKPVYSSPNSCPDSACEGDDELSELYHPLFDKYGVDIVLQAHAHTYQRSFPLAFNQESASNPIVTSTSKVQYINPTGAIFAIVGTGGGELEHELKGTSPFMAFQQDTKFGILDMHFSDNNMESKFVANDGSTLDHFNLSKTAKKKVIERISEDTFSDTNLRPISGKETITNAMPLAQEDKPTITFKLDEAATEANTKTKLAQEDKPNITFKLDEEATTSTNSKVNLLAGQEVQELKPAVTTKHDDSLPKDNPMLLSEEEVKRGQVNPAVTTKLDDSLPKDKQIKLSQETDDNNKPSTISNNASKSIAIEPAFMSNNNEKNDENDEDSDGKNVGTNLIDPFSSLN